MTVAQLCCLLLDQCWPSHSWGWGAPFWGAEPLQLVLWSLLPQERSHLSLSPRASLHRLPS